MNLHSWPACLLTLFVVGCGDEATTVSSSSGSAPAPVTASATSNAATSSATASSTAAAGMTPKAFCAALKKRVGELQARCEEGPAFDGLRQLLKLNIESDLCESRLERVVIDKAKADACLEEVKTFWDTGIADLEHRPSCRAAMRGTAGDGGSCFFSLECAPGSVCAEPLVGDESQRVCSPKIEVGTPCRDRVGLTCGREFECVKGACAARPKLGQDCEENCAPGLRCLRNRSTDPMGKCGPARKAGDTCHRWTECAGVCETPTPAVKDGKCASFCGSP
jgi:hypothetical protein